MGKYYLGYFWCWLPAALFQFLLRVPGIEKVLSVNAVITTQWIFVLIMLVGFGITTSLATYRYPRRALSFILLYTGVNLLLATFLYASSYNTAAYFFLRDYAGIFSYVPMAVAVDLLLRLNVQQEVFVVLTVTVFCLLGYIPGLVRRRVRPDPYRPKIG